MDLFVGKMNKFFAVILGNNNRGISLLINQNGLKIQVKLRGANSN